MRSKMYKIKGGQYTGKPWVIPTGRPFKLYKAVPSHSFSSKKAIHLPGANAASKKRGGALI